MDIENKVKGFLENLNPLSPKIAVIGDLMLDEYLIGEVDRISPEDPVPIVNFKNKITSPGGAGNVAANLCSLTARATVFGAVGNDAAGKEIIKHLKKTGANTSKILKSKKPTIIKQRIIGRDKHLLRIDYEDTTAESGDLREKIFLNFKSALREIDAVVFSDYSKGLISKQLAQNIISLCKKYKKPVFADFKPEHKDFYINTDIITPNFKEAAKIADEEKNLEEIGKSLTKFFNANVLITQGAEGLTIFPKTEKPTHFPVYAAKQIYDVAGAGDTVISCLAWSVCLGLSLCEAAYLANAAGSIAVSKRGTSIISKSELCSLFSANGKLRSLKELKEIFHEAKQTNKKTVFTCGCYDLINSKHIEFLDKASKLGNIFVVALNNDASISKIKGPARPVINLAGRIKMLSALPSIDYIITFDELSPKNILKYLKPEIFVKGGDYSLNEVIEKSTVNKYGGKIEIIPKIDGLSTTNIIENIIKKHTSAKS